MDADFEALALQVAGSAQFARQATVIFKWPSVLANDQERGGSIDSVCVGPAMRSDQVRRFCLGHRGKPAREGDALKGDATAQTTAATMIRFELDPTARDEQLAKARARRDALPRGPKGDISL